MDRQAFNSAIADVLSISPEEVSDETELTDNWDSFAHLATISAIDERFGITIPAKELVAVRTVGELLTLVEAAIRAESKETT